MCKIHKADNILLELRSCSDCSVAICRHEPPRGVPLASWLALSDEIPFLRVLFSRRQNSPLTWDLSTLEIGDFLWSRGSWERQSLGSETPSWDNWISSVSLFGRHFHWRGPKGNQRFWAQFGLELSTERHKAIDFSWFFYNSPIYMWGLLPGILQVLPKALGEKHWERWRDASYGIEVQILWRLALWCSQFCASSQDIRISVWLEFATLHDLR